MQQSNLVINNERHHAFQTFNTKVKIDQDAHSSINDKLLWIKTNATNDQQSIIPNYWPLISSF